MSAFLAKCLEIARVDPDGWVVARDEPTWDRPVPRIHSIRYGDTIRFEFRYKHFSQVTPKYIVCISPFSKKLSWWESRQLEKLVNNLAMSKVNSVSVGAAESVLKRRLDELDRISKELEVKINA